MVERNGSINSLNDRKSGPHWLPIGFGVLAVLVLCLSYLAIGFLLYLVGIHQFPPTLPFPLPFEDAAMLYRYAENLGDGAGIVFNPGQHPSESDGATDLLFVLILGPLTAVGIPAYVAGLVVNLTAVFSLGLLVGYLQLRWWNLARVYPTLVVVSLSGVPTYSFVAGGFSAPVMGALLCWTWFGSLCLFSRARTIPASWVLVLGMLTGVAGWWRPEGFALGLPFALAGLAMASYGRRRPARDLRGPAVWLASGWLIALAGWVLFRLNYFGQLLPTSAIVKGPKLSFSNLPGVIDHSLLSLKNSLLFFVLALLPLLLVLLFLAWFRKCLAPLAYVLLAVLGFSLMWAPLTITMNWWGRVFWPAVPVITLSTVTFICLIANTNPQNYAVKPTRSVSNVVAGSLAVTIVFCWLMQIAEYKTYWRAPFHSLAYEALRSGDTSGLRIATTEAGLIPLALEDGVALDTYVHNTRSIALNGLDVLPDELDRFRPNVLVAHGQRPVEYLGGEECSGRFGEDWLGMARTMYSYAAEHKFILIRSEEVADCDTFNIFVSSDAPSGAVGRLQGIPSFGRTLAPPAVSARS